MALVNLKKSIVCGCGAIANSESARLLLTTMRTIKKVGYV
jgi:hypothetical protein